MEDTRKYFDYELAYKMYEKCVKLLNKGGIDELDEYFEETGDRENGYTTLFINDLSSIEERIDKLLDYAKLNEYTIEDYEKELKSLEIVKEKLLCN